MHLEDVCGEDDTHLLLVAVQEELSEGDELVGAAICAEAEAVAEHPVAQAAEHYVHRVLHHDVHLVLARHAARLQEPETCDIMTVHTPPARRQEDCLEMGLSVSSNA